MKKIIVNIIILFFVQLAAGQNAKSVYSKGGSEFGFSVGTMWISGDVKSEPFKGRTHSLHWRKGLNNVWSIKLAIQNGQAHGLNFMPTYGLQNSNPVIFQGYDNSNPYFFAYKTNYSSFEFSNLFELTNLAPEVYLKNWNFYLGLGLGIANFKTHLDLKNSNNDIYTQLISQTEFSLSNDYNTIAGRKAILNKLNTIYDQDYETPGPKKDGKFRLGDETNIQPHLILSIGASRKINNVCNFGVEYDVRFSDNDLLDGFDDSIDLAATGNDVIHSLKFVVAFNLGKTHSTKPLYWQNSFSKIEELILDQGLKSDSLWFDDDGDGVVNKLDKQPNSMSDCQVDQYGITLDSDKDGIPDCIDSYPYVNQKDLDHLLNQKLEDIKENFSTKTIELTDSEFNLSEEVISPAFTDQDLIMFQLSKPIYFELNKSVLTAESKKHLLEISKAMKLNTNLKLKVEGYASQKGDNSSNFRLSENRALSTKEFLVNVLDLDSEKIEISHFGEKKPRINAEDQANLFLNRRVELTLFVK